MCSAGACPHIGEVVTPGVYFLLFSILATNKESVNEINYNEGGKIVKICGSFFANCSVSRC